MEERLRDFAVRPSAETPRPLSTKRPVGRLNCRNLVNVFKGEGDGADLYVHYGVPITQYDRSDDMLQVTAREGTFVIGSDRQIQAEQRRTIYGLQTDPESGLAEQSLWINTQTVRSGTGHEGRIRGTRVERRRRRRSAATNG